MNDIRRPRYQRRETSGSIRNTIVELFQANISRNEIARLLNIDRSTVYRWLQRFNEGLDLRNQRRIGRPRCTTEQEDEQIINYVHSHPITTSTKIKRETNLQISRHTFYRRLRETGLDCRIPANKPYLSKAHKDERLGFALEYLPKDKHFWERVIWCDEKTFCNSKQGKTHKNYLNNMLIYM